MAAASTLLHVGTSALLRSALEPFERLLPDLGTPARHPAPSSNTGPIVFVVDADASKRAALASLAATRGWQASTFGTAREFLQAARVQAPSCIVLDVDMPDMHGLTLQQRVAIERPEMPVIFLTGLRDVATTVAAMKAGAMEFLIKPCDDSTLVQAIAGALERSRIALARRIHEDKLRERYGCLTGREREVFALVVSGLLNKQVAGRLGISEITVKVHRGSAMRKMCARSLAELVTMAGQLGVSKLGCSAPDRPDGDRGTMQPAHRQFGAPALLEQAA